jgi:hypothetical protein
MKKVKNILSMDDLKPPNVLLALGDGLVLAFLSDFGLPDGLCSCRLLVLFYLIGSEMCS